MDGEFSDSDKKLIGELMKNGNLVTPNALKIIKENNLVDKVLQLEKTVIDETVLKNLEEREENGELEKQEGHEKIEKTEELKEQENKIAGDVEFRLENAECDHRQRKAADFISYFNSKFFLLQQTLVKRLNPISIANMKKTANDEVSLIGMVFDIRISANGNKIIELEDPTGKVSGIIMKESNEDLFKESESILMDEVIGVNGYSKNNYLFIKEIIRPEIPIKHEIKKLDVPIGCVFISDLHVGSVDFIEPTFIKFIKWLNSKDAEKVKYIFIAGDLCDGIGIYLSQENDLSVKNVEKQYEILTEYLSKIPNHIKIIVQPGNHDIVGNHEPQQTLEKTALSQLPNIIFGTNPCSVILDNKIRILMYHGYSYDDVIGNLPLIRQEGYSKPCLPMIEVLKRRHLAPSYGASLVIPEQTDHLVISEVPDIFHSGHLHTVGLENYKNTLLINSGTFQGRTSFQKEQGHIPHPGIFAYVDMQTRESRLVNLNEMEF